MTTFPSLTPVCLSSLATGAHPDVHGIPHLVWFHRAEERFVEYGSSFSAIRAAGPTRAMRDAVFSMNEEHLSRDAATVFESLEGAGLVTAAVNMVCYRGPARHESTVPGLGRPAFGPSRFFYYNLFESDVTGSPLAIRTRARGSVDEYARRRRTLARDAGRLRSPRLLPSGLRLRVARRRAGGRRTPPSAAPTRAIGSLLEAAGGPDEFLERYAVLLCSDHGQTRVERLGPPRGLVLRLPALPPGQRTRRRARRDRLQPGGDGLPPPRLHGRRARARRASARELGHVVLFRESDSAVAQRRRGGASLRAE